MRSAYLCNLGLVVISKLPTEAIRDNFSVNYPITGGVKVVILIYQIEFIISLMSKKMLWVIRGIFSFSIIPFSLVFGKGEGGVQKRSKTISISNVRKKIFHDDYFDLVSQWVKPHLHKYILQPPKI